MFTTNRVYTFHYRLYRLVGLHIQAPHHFLYAIPYSPYVRNNKLFLANLSAQASIDCPQIIALQNRYATHSIKLEYPRYQLCHIILQLVFVRNWHSSIRTQWTFVHYFLFLSVQPYLLLLSIITLPLISLCAMRLFRSKRLSISAVKITVRILFHYSYTMIAIMTLIFRIHS